MVVEDRQRPVRRAGHEDRLALAESHVVDVLAVQVQDARLHLVVRPVVRLVREQRRLQQVPRRQPDQERVLAQLRQVVHRVENVLVQLDPVLGRLVRHLRRLLSLLEKVHFRRRPRHREAALERQDLLDFEAAGEVRLDLQLELELVQLVHEEQLALDRAEDQRVVRVAQDRVRQHVARVVLHEVLEHVVSEGQARVAVLDLALQQLEGRLFLVREAVDQQHALFVRVEEHVHRLVQEGQLHRVLDLELVPLEDDQVPRVGHRRQVLVVLLQEELHRHEVRARQLGVEQAPLLLALQVEEPVAQVDHLDQAHVQRPLGDGQEALGAAQSDARDALHALGRRDDHLLLGLEVVDDRVVSGCA